MHDIFKLSSTYLDFKDFADTSDISKVFRPADIMRLLDSITDLTSSIFSGSFYANSARRSHQKNAPPNRLWRLAWFR